MKFNKERLNQLRVYENRVSLSFDHNFHRNTAKKLKKKCVYLFFAHSSGKYSELAVKSRKFENPRFKVPMHHLFSFQFI